MFRNRWLIALGAIVTAFVLVSADAHARVGGGFSGGSRGMRTRVAIYARVSTDDRRLSHDRPTSLTSSRNTSAHGLLPQCGRSLVG